MTKGGPEDLLGLIAADDQGEVLVLLIEPVKQGQLLLAMTGIVGGVDVQGQGMGGLIERVDEVIDEEVVESPEGGDVDGVFKT